MGQMSRVSPGSSLGELKERIFTSDRLVVDTLNLPLHLSINDRERNKTTQGKELGAQVDG